MSGNDEVEVEATDEEVDPRPFVFAQLELDGEFFLGLSQEDQAEELDVVEGAQLRRHLGRSFFFVILILSFVLFELQGVVLFAACGLCALLAGRDIAALAHKRRVLAYARQLFLADEESAES